MNGEAEFNVRFKDGVLFVTISSLEINGKPVPDEFFNSFRGQNIAKDANTNPKYAQAIRNLESVEIKDGKLIITPRQRADSREHGQARGFPRHRGPRQGVRRAPAGKDAESDAGRISPRDAGRAGQDTLSFAQG